MIAMSHPSKPAKPRANPHGAALSDESVAARRQTRSILRVIVVVLLIAAASALLFALRGILLLILFSVFFAYLLAPVVELAHRPARLGRRRLRLPRAAAIVVVYLFVFGVLVAGAYLLLPTIGAQLTELGKAVPSYLALQREHARSLDSWYQRAHLPPAVRAAVASLGPRALDGIARHGEELSADLLASVRFLPFLVLIPVVAFFLLKDAETFRRSALLALPSGRVRWRGADFLTEVNTTLAFFIRAQLTACLFIGTVCTIGFVAVRVPYGLVLGGAAAILEIIPVIGPMTTLVAAVLFASTRSLGLALSVAAFLVVLRLVHDYVVYPRLIARGIKLHPLAIILA
ncbi:MAG: transport protein, partial [bacterium]|nr:transport protein [bacterium]